MHEMSITQSMIEVATHHCGGRHVRSVTVMIGALSGVVPDAVRFCFEACTAGTLLEGAELVIEEVPARALCPSCAAESAVTSYFDPCPACGAYGMRITAGEELRVKELEVAD